MKFKKLSVMLLFVFGFMLAAVAFGQATPSASPAVNAAVNAVNTAASKVPSSMPGWLIAALSFLITELAARGIPTTKPQSWFLITEGMLGAVVALLQKIQALLVNVGTAFNNVSGPPSP